MRNYRQIAKSGSQLMWAGAGKSQAGGGDIILVPFMKDEIKIISIGSASNAQSTVDREREIDDSE